MKQNRKKKKSENRQGAQSKLKMKLPKYDKYRKKFECVLIFFLKITQNKLRMKLSLIL